MKKRIVLVLAAVALLAAALVFAAQASTTKVDLTTFKCPCSKCDGKPYAGTWITVDDIIAGKSVITPNDGDHFYIDSTITPGDQIGIGANKEVVFLLDNATLKENKNDGARLFGVNAAGAVLHVIGNKGTITGPGLASGTGCVAMIGNGTAEMHLYGDLTVQKFANTSNVSTSAGLFRMYQGTLHIHDCDGMGLPSDNDPVLNAPNLATNTETASKGGVTVLENTNCTFIMDAGTINGSACAYTGGIIHAEKGTITLNGGTLIASNTDGAVVNGGALYLGGATVTLDGATITGGKAKYGGAVYLASGTMVMESGTINGGACTGQGGVAYLASGATFDMRGGTVNVASTGSGAKGFRVQSGTVKASGNALINCPGLRTGDAVDLVSVSANTSARLFLADNATLRVVANGQPTGQWKNVIHAQNYSNYPSKVIVQPGWTGSASVRYDYLFGSGNKTADYSVGMTLPAAAGEASGAFTGKLYMEEADQNPTLHWDGTTGLRAADVKICTTTGHAWYASNADAVAAYAAAPAGYIKLYNNNALDLAGNDVYVDFNGFSPAVTTGSGKLYGIDTSATGAQAGTSQVAVTGNVETFVTAPVTGESFIAFAKDGLTTFHVIKPVVEQVTLRPSVAGIYYGGKVYCDDVLREYVTACGVAVSTQGMPGADFKQTSHYTQVQLPDEGTFNGVLVRDILKQDADNQTRALTNVYANVYVTVEVDGQTRTYLSDATGNGADLNLRRVARKVNGIWRNLTDLQKTEVHDMYEKYIDLMGSEDWRLYNVNAYHNGDTHVKSDLKILMIGNSLSVDAGHMLTYIAKLEGAESVHISTLYYGGCTLAQHVDFLTNNKAVYRFYNTKVTDLQNEDDLTKLIPKVLSSGDNYTMQMGLEYENTPWDIIVMQQGVFQAGQADSYNEDMQTIMDYAMAHCANPDAIFVWNSIWAGPVHPDMVAKASNGVPPDSSGYAKSYKNNVGYTDSQELDEAAQNIFFGKIMEAVRTKVETNPNFAYFIPAGTAQQNALSSDLWDDTDLYRDYIHASDLARFIYSYMWYCALTDMEFEGVKIDAIPLEVRYNKKDDQSEVEPPTGDLELTQEMKDIITWSIQKAFENPYECTPYPN